jgi:hypothetical protein
MDESPLPWSVDTLTIGNSPVELTFEANAQELGALKDFAGIESVTNFVARLRVSPLSKGRFRLSGTLTANVVQASVVNLEPVLSAIEDSFSVEFWPADAIEEEQDETPFDAELPEALLGHQIPAGVLLSELFVLSLDPYPRNAEDKLDWTPAGNGADPGPFAKLARLKTDTSSGEP